MTQYVADVATLGDSTLQVLRQIDANADGLKRLSDAGGSLNKAVNEMKTISKRQGWKHWAVTLTVAIIVSVLAPFAWQVGSAILDGRLIDSETTKAAQQWNDTMQRYWSLSKSDRQSVNALLGWKNSE